MHTLSICDIGLSPNASSALRSMLKLLEGRTLAAWRTTAPDRADVLVASSTCPPDVVADWRGRGRAIVQIADGPAAQPASPFVLQPPLRVMPLLRMLDTLAEHLCGVPERAPAAPEPAATYTSWSTAESIRALIADDGNGWHVARTSCGAEIWIGEGRAHAAAATFERLRGGSLLVSRPAAAAAAPPAGLARMPVSDLGWFVGLHGPSVLAPWLSEQASHSLRRWPDFGRLGIAPGAIELSALAAAQPRTVAELAAASGRGTDEVHRFLAAASVAGLLVAREPAAPAAAPKRSPWARLVGDLRRHLGLSQ